MTGMGLGLLKFKSDEVANMACSLVECVISQSHGKPLQEQKRLAFIHENKTNLIYAKQDKKKSFQYVLTDSLFVHRGDGILFHSCLLVVEPLVKEQLCLSLARNHCVSLYI